MPVWTQRRTHDRQAPADDLGQITPSNDRVILIASEHRMAVGKERVVSLKTILVHLKAYQDFGPTLGAAIDLAQRFEARLTGLYTLRELAVLKLILGPGHRAVQDAWARDAPLVESVRSAFLDACQTAGVEADFDFGEGNASELLAFAGRCHDLVVVEQSASGLDGLGTDTAEECVLVSGTPTLMIPRHGGFGDTGRRIAVGWNHSRQAAAALHAALPLIAKADQVIVLEGKERDLMTSVTKRPRADIEAYIRHYAENVEVRAYTEPAGSSGPDLQTAARDAGADLLVMGAYGRSAWREFVFGGTTRDVMANLQIPVLMAH